jgi:hypothetical protein
MVGPNEKRLGKGASPLKYMEASWRDYYHPDIIKRKLSAEESTGAIPLRMANS